MTPAHFHAARKRVDTPSGRIAFVERGNGPPALFIHGFPLNGYHWRHQFEGLNDMRRCIAPDLMGLGHSEISADRDLDFDAQARMLTEFLDALGLDQIDLVANDSGGAIAQILSTNAPGRIRTLTLTNCDTIGNWPPPAFAPIFDLARTGRLGATLAAFLANPELAQSPRGLGAAFEFPDRLTPALLEVYLGPLVATQARQSQIDRYVGAIDGSAHPRLEEGLASFDRPTLIVWGTADPFFAAGADPRGAYWLRDTIPGVREVVILAGAKLFFPEERADELNAALRAHWTRFGW